MVRVQHVVVARVLFERSAGGRGKHGATQKGAQGTRTFRSRGQRLNKPTRGSRQIGRDKGLAQAGRGSYVECGGELVHVDIALVRPDLLKVVKTATD